MLFVDGGKYNDLFFVISVVVIYCGIIMFEFKLFDVVNKCGKLCKFLSNK